MKLLVLGGTEFAGKAVVEEALARQWQVTVLNRGTNPTPDGARAFVGDRLDPHGLDSLRGESWDLVVDTWSGAPTAVRDSAALLADSAESYLFVSTRSVYDGAGAGSDELAPVVEASPDDGETVYPRDKRGAELGAIAAFGERAILARAGLIVGPDDNVGRLPWWLSRIDRGGRVLAPGPADGGIQLIDSRDFATWCLDAGQLRLGGAYDLVSPVGFATFETLLEACVIATGSDAELVWVDPQTITEAGIEPWTELPIWFPPGAMRDSLHSSDVSKALNAGLVFRPLRETVDDTWRWLLARDALRGHPSVRAASGLDPEVEARVLASM